MEDMLFYKILKITDFNSPIHFTERKMEFQWDDLLLITQSKTQPVAILQFH